MLWKKTLYYCPLFVCLIVDLTLAVPLMETQTASSDTYISLHGGLGGPNQPHGSDDRMFLIGPVGQFQACPLLMFDLSNFEGDIPSNDIELQLEVVGSHSGGAEVQSRASIHRVLVNWDESSVTWNNFGPEMGLQAGIDFEKQPLDSIAPLSVDGLGSTVSFQIPSSVVRSWIEEPSTNYGIILLSEESGFNMDIHFGVREQNRAATLDLLLTIGDVNQDGVVNLLDVGPFVDVLTNGGFQTEADINQDGVVDLLDVAPFVELLSGG